MIHNSVGFEGFPIDSYSKKTPEGRVTCAIYPFSQVHSCEMKAREALIDKAALLFLKFLIGEYSPIT
jgi:hypothetical protein